MPGLGRRPAPDVRDARFPMRAILPSAPLPAFRYWTPQKILDQGNTGTCVAFAWMSLHQGSPVRFKADPAFTPFDLYRKIVLLDVWPDNDPEATAPDEQLQNGTSVRAGAKACQARGWLASYVWAETVVDIERHVALVGPVVGGFNFYESMFRPDKKGFVHPGGPIAGGHAWCIDGVNRMQGIFRCRNSWGRDWGRGGFFWMTMEDIEDLLREDGEAAAATEQELAQGAKAPDPSVAIHYED